MTLRSSSLFCLLLAGLTAAPATAAERLPALCCPKYPGNVCDCKSYGYFPTCWRFWPACAPTCPPPMPQALIGIPTSAPSNTLPPPAQLPSGPNPPAQMPPAQVPPASSVYARPSIPEQVPSATTPGTAPAEAPADPSK